LFQSFAELQETGFLADKVRDGVPPADQPGSLAFDQDLAGRAFCSWDVTWTQHAPFKQLCPGAPRSHQRTWDENDFLRLLSAGLTPTELFESFADLQETGFLADKVRDGFPPTDQPGSLAFDQDLGWAGPGVVI